MKGPTPPCAGASTMVVATILFVANTGERSWSGKVVAVMEARGERRDEESFVWYGRKEAGRE